MDPSEQYVYSALRRLEHRRKAELYKLQRAGSYKTGFGPGAFFLAAWIWLVIFPVPATVAMLVDGRIFTFYSDVAYDGVGTIVGSVIVLGILVLLTAFVVGLPVGLLIFGVAVWLRRVRVQWVHVLAISMVAAIGSLVLSLVVLPYDRRYLMTYVALTVFSGVAAAIARTSVVSMTLDNPIKRLAQRTGQSAG